MKTDQLIEALAADATPIGAPPRKSLMTATLAGAAIPAFVLLAIMGVRPDLQAALVTWRFDVKLVLVATTVAAALAVFAQAMRPETRPTLRGAPVLVIALAALAVAFELAVTPSGEWVTRMIGTNNLKCLAVIPVLAVAPFVALMWAMRRGAPASPARAGAAVGALASAIAAAFYAPHCFDDSPLFVAVWYSAAIAIVTTAGAVIGARVLRW